MDAKQIIGLLLTIGGAAALVYGVLGLFEGGDVGNGSVWAASILGLVFFVAGIGLMKSVKSTAGGGGAQ